MDAANNTAARAKHPPPTPRHDGSRSAMDDQAFYPDALAPFLADLKRQLALRQAMP